MQQDPSNQNFQANQSNQPSGVDFDLGLLIYLSVKILPWTIIILAVGVGSAFTYLHYTAPIYQSKSIIQLTSDNQANRILQVDDIYERGDISKEIELIRSPEFFRRVISKLPINVSYYSEGEVLTYERYKGSPFSIDFFICL